MKALKTILIGLAVIGLVIVGMISSAAERKPTDDLRTTATRNSVASVQPSVLPASPSSTLIPVVQPEPGYALGAVVAHSVSYQIGWQVISNGGGRQTSASFEMNSTVGQTATGRSSSPSYEMNAGFQQNFSGGDGGCCASLSTDGKTGNVDGDPGKGVDISDLSALIDYMYITFAPPPCMQSANVDGDPAGGVDIADLSALIDFLYISFTPPAACQ